ncbi:MAG: hypothetical protein AAF416_22805, partial [Pseudomonadota bacterium]
MSNRIRLVAHEPSSYAASSTQITLLGPCRLVAPGGREVALASKRAWALLAYLLLAPDRPHPREAIASLLWERSPMGQGLASLRQELSKLRRVLLSASWSPLETTPTTIMGSPQSARVDLIGLLKPPAAADA